jgi:DNA invertase Pin-like site-specific DNA recombinase
MLKKAAIYVRVSTANRTRTGDFFEQNPDVQEAPLRQLAEHRGWSVAHVYSDRMSGAKENRPGLGTLMQDARRGRFDVVLVWRFDRFARSIEQLVIALAEFRALGIDFVSCQEALDINTNAQSHVHHHWRHGGTGAKRDPRARRRRHGIRAPARHEER